MKRAYVKLGWWLLAFIHVGLIWSFSSRSGSEVGLPPPYDKAAHFFSFALLGFLFAKAFGQARLGFLLAALYGVIDEIHQSFVPLRDASFWDWLADVLGAYFGAGSAPQAKSVMQTKQATEPPKPRELEQMKEKKKIGITKS